MEVRRAYKYRLYPTGAQARELERILSRCRDLYNVALYQRREAYRVCGQNVGYYVQKRELPALRAADANYRRVGSQVLQDVIRRVDLAFVAAFFRRVKAGETPGFPRFRGRDRYDSFTYSQAGWKLAADGRLVLSGIGALKVRWSRPIQGTIKTVTIRRSAEQWYVCFSCVIEVAQPLQPDRPATAIDVGLECFATFADGCHIANPRFFRREQEVLARRQRKLQSKKRGSKNHRRAKLLVAKSICDAGWNQFLTILTHKAEEAGVVVVVVNPAGTSQVCSGCGRSVPMELADRWHLYPYEDCGLSLQRDHDSARTILHRAGLARAVASAPAAESHVL